MLSVMTPVNVCLPSCAEHKAAIAKRFIIRRLINWSIPNGCSHLRICSARWRIIDGCKNSGGFMKSDKSVWSRAFVALGSLGLLVWCVLLAAQDHGAPKYKFDPDWPKPLPNKWKMGGVTGLAV